MLKQIFKVFAKKPKIEKSAGLGKTRKQFREYFSNFTSKDKLSKDDISNIESVMFKSDIGVSFTKKFIETLKEKEISGKGLNKQLRVELSDYLAKFEGRVNLDKKPYVILFSGVNGAGKTTSIGKLAYYFKQQNKKVLLAACDTYRAAAVRQLEVWAERANVEIISPEKEGADPAAIAHKAVTKAKEEDYDIVLIDTAGRLQNYKNLMEQLAKISRVIKKLDESAPHLSLLTIDGTTGQNAIKQYQGFSDSIEVNGLIVTKLDGTAKGGILVALADLFNANIYFLGQGEAISDLKEFSASDFAEEIFAD
ncbi:MAG: signal recognition particle-docking protein FtsY [Rickettsiales bacterium]|jgi:fused signal recognition particle receptor|nr:signal recognition particle-docking protein FtsY [Rickettsiales bacterium]